METGSAWKLDPQRMRYLLVDPQQQIGLLVVSQLFGYTGSTTNEIWYH